MQAWDWVRPAAFISADGRQLHVRCRGTGDPVVLLESGIAASSLSWALVQPDIAAFTQVCAYDRAGLAWSDAPSCPRTFDDILRDVARVVTSMAAGRPLILVGHSFGSLIVRAYAARHPENIAGLVLVDPPTEWIRMGPEQARLLRGARRLSRVGEFLARVGVVRLSLALLTGGRPGPPRRFVRVFGSRAAGTLERLVGEVRKLPPELHPIVQSHWSQPKCFRAMADYLNILEHEGAEIAAMTPSPDIPVVVISGAHQTAREISTHRQLASVSPLGWHVVAPSSGHWIPFDQPEIIVAAVRELAGISSCTATVMDETHASSATRQTDGAAAGQADDEVKSVGDLLDRVDAAARAHEPTSVGDVLETVGNRSFGPLLLLAGVVMLAPVVGDIPGVPVMMGLLVILTTGQFLAGRDHFWLPGWLVRRSVSHEKIRTGVRWLRPVGRFLDRWSRPRLTRVVRGAGLMVGGVACSVLAAATPLMEVVPFSANVAGIAITAYGLAVIASDGVVALVAMAFSAGTFVLLVRQLLS